MKLGRAAILVVALGAPIDLGVGLGVGLGAGLGCSRDARPAQPTVAPDEHPPLPPASGTPIGYLVDGAGELTLTADQIDQLRAIDDQLARQLAADDGEMRPDPVPVSGREDKPRGLGLRGAAAGPDRTGAINAGSTSSGQASPSSGQIVIPASTVNQVNQQRARHIRDAIRRVFAVLDSAQQAGARRVLTDHGVDPDSGEVQGGEPGASPLEEPKLGKPLPREP
jgi:hypothetical protein